MHGERQQFYAYKSYISGQSAGNMHHIPMYLTAGHINIAVLLPMNVDKVLFWIILTWNKTQMLSVHGVLQHVPQCSLQPGPKTLFL